MTLPDVPTGFTYSEQHRRECEARYWLKAGYGHPVRIDELMASIAVKRGQAVADRLREEMRRQWTLFKAPSA